MTTWHKGPPPEIGWWPASGCRDETAIRWWNGEEWSREAYPACSAEYAAHMALIVSPNQKQIEWTGRWWL